MNMILSTKILIQIFHIDFLSTLKNAKDIQILERSTPEAIPH